MEEEQLWAQLELRAARVCEVLEYALETTGEGVDENGNERELQISQRRMEGAGDGDVDMEDLEGLESDEDEDFEEDSEDEEDEDEDDDDEEEEGGDEEDGEEAEDLGEHMAELRDPSDEDNSDSDLDKPSVLPGGQRPSRWRAKAKGHPELDDGFFDLAAFNAETEEAESKTVSKGRLAEDEDSDEDMDEEMDYFALVDEGADGELDGTQGGWLFTFSCAPADRSYCRIEILYKDFFEPPARVSSKSKKSRSSTQIAEVSKTSSGKVRFHEEVRVKNIRAKGKNLPTSSMFALDEDEDDEDDEDYDEEMAEGDELESYGDSFEDTGEVSGSSEDLEALDEDEGPQPHETIERLKDDLFADDDEELDQGMHASSSSHK